MSDALIEILTETAKTSAKATLIAVIAVTAILAVKESPPKE
ncbi:hypothetical protein ACLRAI_05195 [[Pasteurella] aerogenes]